MMGAARWKVRSETRRYPQQDFLEPTVCRPRGNVRRKCLNGSDGNESHRIDDDGVSHNEMRLFLH
jgi:hypothetical protein